MSQRKRRVRSTAGVPKGWLQQIDESEAESFDRVYVSPDGVNYILKDERASAGNFSTNVAHQIKSHFGTSDESSLRCPLCSQIFLAPMVVPCCGESYCLACISSAISQGAGCPSCRSPVSQADLERNETLQASVVAVVNSLNPLL